MLDQSFSVENFKRIIELENRKGIYLEGEFLSRVANINGEIKQVRIDRSNLSKTGLTDLEYFSKREILRLKLEKLKIKKDEALTEELLGVSSEITASDFKIELIKDDKITKKPVYKLPKSLSQILCMKQLQYNVRKVYKVKQGNRFSIVSQVKNILDNGFPKYLIRTDIKDFYESIVQERLIKVINEDNLLTNISRKLIKKLFTQYNTLTGMSIGAPRGMGITPFLVELYMRQVDLRIKSLPHVIYYARYVDDIIVVFSPPVDSVVRTYKTELSGILLSEGLIMNETKTFEYNLFKSVPDLSYDMEFLGYRFISGYQSKKHIPLQVRISTKKRSRYLKRIVKMLRLYQHGAKLNERKARAMLVKRMRFLTTNVRLINNKQNVLTGIYYSNSLINNQDDFVYFDSFFSRMLTRLHIPVRAQNRCNKYSFQQGLSPDNIASFKPSDLTNILDKWY